jgi:hypothetical protein
MLLCCSAFACSGAVSDPGTNNPGGLGSAPGTGGASAGGSNPSGGQAGSTTGAGSTSTGTAGTSAGGSAPSAGAAGSSSGSTGAAGSGGSTSQHAPPQSPTASLVYVDGYRLMVGKRASDGTLASPTPYEVRGVSWSPTGVGETNSSGYSKLYISHGGTDVPLIAGLHANTIKTYDPFRPQQRGHRATRPTLRLGRDGDHDRDRHARHLAS